MCKLASLKETQTVTKMSYTTRDSKVVVPLEDANRLARLRHAANNKCMQLPGQGSRQKKVQFFENPEAATEPLLKVRERGNQLPYLANVDHIEHYVMSGININDNLVANQSHKRRKVLNRDYMMVEKHLGFYRADYDLLDDENIVGKCASCGKTVTAEEYEEIQKPQPLCDFCHHKWKVILESSAATSNRKVERKRNKREREQHITEKGKKKDKDKEKVPRIMVREAGMKEEEMQYKIYQKKNFDFTSSAYMKKPTPLFDDDDANLDDDDDHDDSDDFDPEDDVL